MCCVSDAAFAVVAAVCRTLDVGLYSKSRKRIYTILLFCCLKGQMLLVGIAPYPTPLYKHLYLHLGWEKTKKLDWKVFLGGKRFSHFAAINRVHSVSLVVGMRLCIRWC